MEKREKGEKDRKKWRVCEKKGVTESVKERNKKEEKKKWKQQGGWKEWRKIKRGGRDERWTEMRKIKR